MKKKNYRISVITPIYNVEEYLEEAIQSVTAQTIGFKENIQLILVNDGSPDNSRLICKKYVDLYPDNVVYIEKPNGGVSSARNVGLSSAFGKYIVFLDGDDLWSVDAFEKIDNFFSMHYEEIDVCSCRMQYIGDFAKKTHPLDYKYQNGSNVVSLEEHPLFINTTLGNVVFKSESIKNATFDETMKYCEDSLFINKLISEKMKLGIVHDAVFYYRKNNVGTNASINIIRQRAWFFDIPEQYYLKLLSYVDNKFGFIPEVFQQTIFYDVKWRGYNPDVLTCFTDEEKQKHIELLSDVLKRIDDTVIMKARNINTYKKNYFLGLKHQKNILKEAKLSNGILTYNSLPVLNLKARQMVFVRAMAIDADILTIEGVLRFTCIPLPYRFYIKDDANEGQYIIPEIKKDPDRDLRGVVGECIVEGEIFRASIPVRHGSTFSFYADIGDETIKIKPDYANNTGLRSRYNNSFYCTEGRIIQQNKEKIRIYKNNLLNRAICEKRFLHSVEKKAGKSIKQKLRRELRERRKLQHAPLQKKIAFISVRAEDRLLENMNRVYSEIDLPKEQFSRVKLGVRKEELEKAKEIMSTSSVVVTDDYLGLMKNKKKGQKFVQLWHATGGGKHFGQDGTNMFLIEDANYHKNYDLVTVSSEYVRDIYASAFAIPRERIVATGVARTDAFFDEEYKQKAVGRVLEKYPELENKEIILYTPTFRDIKGKNRGIFEPKLDFSLLSQEMSEKQFFVIKPHPVMLAPIIDGEYDNIKEIRDIETSDLMFASDMMITDYSSTMFEYALLKKPMGFFCYDYDEYDRDFYIDFNTELPGPLLRTQEELIRFLAEKEHPITGDFEYFYQKYMGSCDGHSTERIVRLIEDLYYGKDEKWFTE